LGRTAGEFVYGWAFDDTNPKVRLTVRVRLGDRELARTEASIPRDDLRPVSGEEDGAHGYTFSLPLSLTDAERAELVVSASHPDAEAWQDLPRYRPELSGNGGPQSAPAPGAEGEPDWASPGVIAAVDFWADPPDRPRTEDDGAFPVFVLGAPRSGTSALFAAVTRTTRYRGFNEGHLLDIAASVASVMKTRIDRKLRNLSADAVARYHLGRDPCARLGDGLRLLLRAAAAGYTTPYWIDKTPNREMVQSAPFLAATWANARFVFMKRRGIENLMSRLRKFPRVSFEAQCLDWAAVMSDWRNIRSSIAGKFIEVDQRDLLRDPIGSAGVIGALIGLDEAETEALGERLGSERAEMTDPTSRIVADIAETGWSPAMIDTFRAICGPEMEAYGYTWDANYRAPGREPAMLGPR
jgi:hypothetical protein